MIEAGMWERVEFGEVMVEARVWERMECWLWSWLRPGFGRGLSVVRSWSRPGYGREWSVG